MTDYEHHHYDKDLLKQSAVLLGNIEVNPIADLEQVRNLINKYTEENAECSKLSPDWCFVDCSYLINIYDIFKLLIFVIHIFIIFSLYG